MSDLTLLINGRKYSGWNSARVTRGIERCPSDFEVTMTELFPGEMGGLTFMVVPGDPFQLYLGTLSPDNLVVTGYVDRVTPAIRARLHSITIAGRGKCQDIVDCEAVWPNGQFMSHTVLDIATKLSAPYGVTVSAASPADVGAPIFQVNVAFTETPWSVIERLCRFRALLAYDQPDGNLMLSRVGGHEHMTGLKTGQNVHSAAVTYSTDQRYSEYCAYLLAANNHMDVGEISPLQTVNDPTIKRFRRHNIIAENGDGSQDGAGSVAKMRAQWEASRRWGRSAQLRVTVDSWTDGTGVLWQPNWLVNLDLPEVAISGKKWLISDVAYHMDEQGTSADLLLMAPQAFDPSPILMSTVPFDVADAVAKGK